MNPPREDSVRRAESEIRDVIDAIPAMVWIAAPDGKGTFINRAWTEYLGLSLEEILGFDWPRTVHPDDVDRYLAAWRLSLASGQPLEQEVRYRRADGEYRWFLSRALPVRNKRGEIVEWYGIAADIEDRKRAQEAEGRRESELIEAIPAMAWSASPDSSCTYVNKNWTEYTGLSLEETVGSGWLRAVHQQDAEQHLSFWQKSVATGQPFQNEVRFRRAADGQYRWFTVRGVPLLDEQGRILKWFGIAVDIEDGKRAEQAREEAARRSEREFRDVVNTVPAHVWSTSPEGEVDFVNDRWLQFTGLALDQAFGWKWEAVLHPDDRTRVVADWHTALENGQAMESEARVRRADGEYCWWFIRNVPLRDETGKLVRWYGTAIDIEDRKRAEQALRKSEERWRSVFENSAIGVALTDLNGRFLATNHVFQAMVGYTEEELRAVNILDLTHEDYREANWALITELLEGKRRQFQIEKEYRRKDGSLIWVSNNVSLVPGTERVPRFIMALSEEITQRKRAEESLQRSEGYLAEAQKLTHTGSWAAQVYQMENVSWSNFYWSEELYRIFGFDPDPTPPSEVEIAGRLHPEDVLCNRPVVEQAIRDRSDFEVDYRLVLPNGAAKYIHVVGHPIVNASGDVIEIVGTAMDITQRKRAEDALRASEASLLEAQRLTRTCSWRHEVLSDKVTVSPEGLLMYGIEPEDDASSADFYFGRMHPKDRPEVEQAYAAALLGKTDFEADFRIVLPDGTIKNTRSIGHPILDERGDVVEFVGAAIDVTEHHRAAQALRRSEAYLAEAQKLTKTGSWARDPRADLIVYCSDEIYRIFGVNPADGIPSTETLMQRVHPDDRTRIRARMEEGVRDKVEHSFEYRIMLPDGNVKYLHHLRRPVINDAGEVVELIGTTMDITERKQAEEAKKAAEELASSHVEVMMRSLDVLAKEPAPEKYIAEILRTIAQHLRAHRVILWLREQNDDSLRLHTVILNDKPIVTDETDHPFVRTPSSWKQIPFLAGMLATKSTAVCEDVADDSRLTSEWRKYLTSQKTKRLVSVPMFLAGEFRGFISIHHSEAGTYRPDEIELAQSLAQHVM
ncbi:MAG TPA: PAS domain-containing protein, partial [Blastocatellia bacterium]|nr:PAS domain-containing protein [Blastocatellia bacterium]